MPSLRHLIEELMKLKVDPDEVRLPASVYDQIIEDAEASAEDED